jgi:hypothetical protein
MALYDHLSRKSFIVFGRRPVWNLDAARFSPGPTRWRLAPTSEQSERSKRGRRNVLAARSDGRRQKRRHVSRESGGTRQEGRCYWWCSPNAQNWLRFRDRSHMTDYERENMMNQANDWIGLAPVAWIACAVVRAARARDHASTSVAGSGNQVTRWGDRATTPARCVDSGRSDARPEIAAVQALSGTFRAAFGL